MFRDNIFYLLIEYSTLQYWQIGKSEGGALLISHKI